MTSIERPELPAGFPVEIEYARAGADLLVYRQHLVAASDAAIVTYQPSTPLPRPKEVDGRVILEPGSPVVWFTFEQMWHDIGVFHLADGTPTGLYANVLTPVELFVPGPVAWRWRTTDLCLDLWLDDRGPVLLDVDELERAQEEGAISGPEADRARAEGERLLAAARNDEWPPAVVSEWPLEAARAQVEG